MCVGWGAVGELNKLADRGRVLSWGGLVSGAVAVRGWARRQTGRKPVKPKLDAQGAFGIAAAQAWLVRGLVKRWRRVAVGQRGLGLG